MTIYNNEEQRLVDIVLDFLENSTVIKDIDKRLERLELLEAVDQIKTEGIKLKDANSCVVCHQMLFSPLFDCQINGEPRKICKQCIDKVEWSKRVINDQDIR